MATIRCMRLMHCMQNLLLLPRKTVNICPVFHRSYRRGLRRYLKELYQRRLKAGPEPERHPSQLGIWNHDAELFAFGKRFGEEFDENLLKRAFVQRNYIIKEENKRKELGIDLITVPLGLVDNEDLARKGEEIASRYIKAYLRYSYPHMFEEGICAVHDFLMSHQTLLHIGMNIGLRELIMSAEYPPPEQAYILTFKAVIGALAVSQNVERAEVFVKDIIIPQLIGKDINELWEIVNPMGLLKAMLASEGRGPPEPRLLWHSASATVMSLYHVGLYSDKELIGKSPGETVTIAEEMAARNALKHLMQTTDSRAPLTLGAKAVKIKLDYDKKNRSIRDLLNETVEERLYGTEI
ncbi:hypothetical protein CHS0354_024633 [Potamilus streckersoni]|uniref:Large ribosomal subunit protein mL44 n=1 Tax=Potamilus streckersoni TaxID=2493646 RepID=A0AAE0SW08_9BIVA|nr:hypothetical protein CHS0354_024633 [Potamilus streckersoni]